MSDKRWGEGENVSPGPGSASGQRELALSGLRVIDLATYVAAPFCATMMAEFGAEVIKVEMPRQGDPLRTLGVQYKGVGLMWAQENRNKKGVTCDLRHSKGQKIVRDLAMHADVLVENFRPGTMERWNLGYEALRQENPRLIMVRISGYGQTGPYSSKAAFAKAAQAFGGLTYLAGFPDRPPVDPGSATLADYLGGLFAAFATLVALEHRRNTGLGQCIDISLFECVFRVLDNLTLAYDKLGMVRERSGTSTVHAVPHSHYPTKDGKWIAIACTNDRMFQRLAKAMGREDLAEGHVYSTMAGRLEHRQEVDTLVSEWTRTLERKGLIAVLDSEEVPAAPINSIADIFRDPHYRERGAIIEIEDPMLGKARMPGIVPRLSLTPGRVKHLAPSLGQHNEEVYCGLLGYSKKRLDLLRKEGVI